MLVIGLHPGIIQSILDFDAMLGRTTPSICAVVAGNRSVVKFFFGTTEIRLPCYRSVAHVPEELRARCNFLLNLQSGRRAKDSTVAFFASTPHALGAHLFAENIPESHAQELIDRYPDKWILGPAGVGLLVAGHFKLGAIGGITPTQITESALLTPGSVAVISTSGGMIGELMRSVVNADKRMSFAACVGGDRFPTTSFTDLFTLAEEDPQTSAVVYFGELGGEDEYEIVSLIESKRFTKPLIAYIAGTVGEVFPEQTQFGHAKALARSKSETARAKRDALTAAGATAPDTFINFLDALTTLPQPPVSDPTIELTPYQSRRASLLSTRRFPTIDRQTATNSDHFTRAILAVLLPAPPQSTILVDFTTTIFTSLIDHGGHVSGAVNTMITARAGKDLVSSLTAGLLTIGPRFGGAVNAAAATWRDGVATGAEARAFVEERTQRGELIAGIGHRKYRLDIPDPRVATLAAYVSKLQAHPHYDLARAVEAVTSAKNGSLILNVDGAIASIMLDILAEHEGYTPEALDALIDSEFFNALFVIPRTVGFIGHFLEQKRNDEGLFRLPDDLLYEE